MKTIKIGNKNYKIEFSFASAECEDVVQKVFEYVTGIGMLATASEEENEVRGMLKSTGELISKYATLCKDCFYAGLLENNPVERDEAKELMKKYMKANSLSFYDLYQEIVSCMEEDGFFDLIGLTQVVDQMTQAIEEE